MTTKAKRPRVSLERFVQVYCNDLLTLQEVADELGMSKLTVGARASKLRSEPHNIPLPDKRQGVGGPKIDRKKVLEFMAKARNTTVEELEKASQKMVADREAKEAKKEKTNASTETAKG